MLSLTTVAVRSVLRRWEGRALSRTPIKKLVMPLLRQSATGQSLVAVVDLRPVLQRAQLQQLLQLLRDMNLTIRSIKP